MNKPLLSICIPTYNRCKTLDRTLDSLFCNPDFDIHKVEVIVSDNASTDNTKNVVSKYPLVKYYCNDYNLGDANFDIVLSYGIGEYIKLFNDTLSFNGGILGRMLFIIENNINDKPNLFFYQNMFTNSYCTKFINTVSEFLDQVSFHTTWIINFGVWRIDYDLIQDKKKYSELHLLQVDWSYQIVNNTKRTIIVFDNNHTIENVKKGGYNIFQVFVTNYLFILRKHKPSIHSLKLEKYRLYRYFIIYWIKSLIIDKNEHTFDLKKTFKIIFKNYWYALYFYISILFLFYFKIKKFFNTVN
jgi:glycosyltransferase involved in cell wall biosynthesis